MNSITNGYVTFANSFFEAKIRKCLCGFFSFAVNTDFSFLFWEFFPKMNFKNCRKLNSGKLNMIHSNRTKNLFKSEKYLRTRFYYDFDLFKHLRLITYSFKFNFEVFYVLNFTKQCFNSLLFRNRYIFPNISKSEIYKRLFLNKRKWHQYFGFFSSKPKKGFILSEFVALKNDNIFPTKISFLD